jgi:glycolate dehydrogenase iron-sulfur subunit
LRHEIDPERLGSGGEAMAAAVGACVHCGFCLPTCPTYVTMEEEMDSPRGRILLIKEALEGGLNVDLALPYIDNCLGCQACVSACPSGVEYGELITAFRAHTEPRRRRSPADRVRRALLLATLSEPRRFRLASRLAAIGRKLRPILPGSLRTMVDLAPRRLPAQRPLPEVHPAVGRRRGRVALLGGCVQQALAPEINWAALRVLARNGVETVVPTGQGCCGALALHTGAAARARAQARRNLVAFPDDVDAVISTTAGCGSGMREYGLLFAAEPEAERAAAFAAQTLDVTTYLNALGLRADPPPLATPLAIAYQDACHLAHAQGERDAPRALLRSIPGLELREVREPELCCGSAGTYNIERPETARELGSRKARNLIETGADLVVSGNVGCLNQLRTHLAAAEHPLPVLHTIQVLDAAYDSVLEEGIAG